MIRANELRLGNCVNTKEFHIKDVQGFYQVKVDWLMYSRMFEPILLTEEILLKCGFELLPKDKCRTYKTFKVGKRYLYFDESDGVWYLSYDEYIAYCNNIGIVEYLHDLQNLYYYTSRDGVYDEKEELEIKL